LEEGKLSKKYFDSVNHVQLNPEDIEKLGLKEGDRVKITTDYGSVNVAWISDNGLDHGVVFFPYGPWANQVYSSLTGSTGMPIMKGIPAKIEVTKEEVPSLEEIVDMLRRSA
jgi:formylmethanofuran dehydrogenase subunit D